MMSPAVAVRRNRMFVVVVWLITLLLLLKCNKTWDKKMVWREWISQNREFVIVLLFCMISRCFMLAKLQRWDGALYYGAISDACRAFDFSFHSFWNTFRFFGHPTLGYAFFMCMGEFLTPGRLIGVYMVHLVLTGAALYCIYMLFQGYWMRVSRPRAAVYTFIVSAVPLFWGTFSYINPDYCIILFFVFMVYEESREHYLLMTFWLIILVLTKETAMLVAAGYFLFKGCYYFFHGKYPLHIRAVNVFRNRCMQIALVGAAGAGIFFLKQGGLFSWASIGGLDDLIELQTESGTLPYNAVAVDSGFIFHQFKLGFVLNFAWILTAIAVLAGVVGLCRKKQNLCQENWVENTIGMLGGFTAVTAFLMVFITVPLNRYHVFTAVVFTIIVLILYENMIKIRIACKINAERCGLLLLSGLFTAQTFLSIDPVSNAIFTVGDTGKMKMLATGGIFEPYFDDTTVNNYQYTWMDGELERMLVEAGYDSDTLVIGNKYNLKIFNLGWNDVKNRMEVWSEFRPDTHLIKTISTRRLQQRLDEGNFYESDASEKGKAIIFFTRYNEESEEEWLAKLDPYYEIGERRETDGSWGSLAYYQMTLKEKE